MKISEYKSFRFPEFSIEYFRMVMMKNPVILKSSILKSHPATDQPSERICEVVFLSRYSVGLQD
jgi:hypothetical protein